MVSLLNGSGGDVARVLVATTEPHLYACSEL